MENKYKEMAYALACECVDITYVAVPEVIDETTVNNVRCGFNHRQAAELVRKRGLAKEVLRELEKITFVPAPPSPNPEVVSQLEWLDWLNGADLYDVAEAKIMPILNLHLGKPAVRRYDSAASLADVAHAVLKTLHDSPRSLSVYLRQKAEDAYQKSIAPPVLLNTQGFTVSVFRARDSDGWKYRLNEDTSPCTEVFGSYGLALTAAGFDFGRRLAHANAEKEG